LPKIQTKGGHCARNELCDFLGRGESDSLGDEFPENQRKIGRDNQNRRLSAESRPLFGHAHIAQICAELARDCVARINTREDSDEGDSDLDGREKSFGIFRQRDCAFCGFASVLCVRRKIRLAQRNERDFRHCKYSV